MRAFLLKQYLGDTLLSNIFRIATKYISQNSFHKSKAYGDTNRITKVAYPWIVKPIQEGKKFFTFKLSITKIRRTKAKTLNWL